MATFKHDPDAKLDYGFNWSTWLGADTITTSTWTVTGASVLPVLSGSAHDTTTTTVWVDGGTTGKTCTVTNHIVTAAGREDDRSHLLEIVQR